MKFGPLRIGMLGAANVGEYAVVAPTRDGADIVVSAIAARDPERAHEYARRHGIGRVFNSYDQLLAEADIDAVYVALPNALHHRWTIAALKAGFPVLCEKPFAANVAEATDMAEAAERAGLPLLEAMHWRDHPVAAAIMQSVAKIGRLRSIETRYSLPGNLLPRDNIRFSPTLAGGWTMDQGCYCVSLLRLVTGAEPLRVVQARAVEYSPGIDGGMEAELLFPDDVQGRLGGSMIDESVHELALWARIEGTSGHVTVSNPYLPGRNPFTREQGARLCLETADGTITTESSDLISSWFCQANAFARLVRAPPKTPNPAWDAVRNMHVVDDIYRAAGMAPRGGNGPRPVD